jgi:hypothetical protein
VLLLLVSRQWKLKAALELFIDAKAFERPSYGLAFERGCGATPAGKYTHLAIRQVWLFGSTAWQKSGARSPVDSM